VRAVAHFGGGGRRWFVGKKKFPISGRLLPTYGVASHQKKKPPFDPFVGRGFEVPFGRSLVALMLFFNS